MTLFIMMSVKKLLADYNLIIENVTEAESGAAWQANDE